MPDYKFEHIHLMSSDPEKTAEFYVKMLGAEKNKVIQMPGGMIIRLNLKGVEIVISSVSGEHVGTSLGHFGLITDNIHAATDELKAANCKIEREPTQIADGTKMAAFRTPDDILIELTEK